MIKNEMKSTHFQIKTKFNINGEIVERDAVAFKYNDEVSPAEWIYDVQAARDLVFEDAAMEWPEGVDSGDAIEYLDQV